MYRTYVFVEEGHAESENGGAAGREGGRGRRAASDGEIPHPRGVREARSKLDVMAYEIPVTQARAELAELINRVVYGGERVVVTRHGKPLVALVSAADLERLEELQEVPEPAEEQVVSSLSSVREVASAPRERQRFGIAAEHRGSGAS